MDNTSNKFCLETFSGTLHTYDAHAENARRLRDNYCFAPYRSWHLGLSRQMLLGTGFEPTQLSKTCSKFSRRVLCIFVVPHKVWPSEQLFMQENSHLVKCFCGLCLGWLLGSSPYVLRERDLSHLRNLKAVGKFFPRILCLFEIRVNVTVQVNICWKQNLQELQTQRQLSKGRILRQNNCLCSEAFPFRALPPP